MNTPVSLASRRLLSLDVFRGLTVAAMILVNNPGSWGHIYAPLKHAPWHGCTPTDLIFPFFLFIVGVAIVYALSGAKETPGSHRSVLGKVLRRSLVLFAIGLFLGLFPAFDFAHMRIPGVLQRIALVFFCCSLLFLKTRWQTRAWIMAAALLLYWALMTLVPVPGVGEANLEPATNLGAWIDNRLLAGHLWSQSRVWDPEGLLSTLPALVTGLAGVLTGEWLRSKREEKEKTLGLFIAGNLALLGGLTWDLAFPLNKALWTSSFVLYTAGWALVVLALLYWLVDVQGYCKAIPPFLAFGMNAIGAFILSGLLPKIFNLIQVSGPGGESMGLRQYFQQTFLVPYFSPLNASLLGAIAFLLLCFLPIWILYKRRIILKV
ncbi:MAG: acyltransferase family protein [Adhaeribacter sp.]